MQPPPSRPDPLARTILVVDAARGQGTLAAMVQAVVHRLCDDGWLVRVLTPEPEALARAVGGHGVEMVRGDLDDKQQIERAVAGVYGVFSVQDPWDERDEVAQAKRLIVAAERAGVRHLVQASAAGTDGGSGLPHLHAKRVVEQYLRERRVPATILRPVYPMECLWDKALDPGLHWAMLKDVLGERTRLQMVASDDVAAFVALAFRHPKRYLGATLELAGDELTYAQAVEAYQRIFDKRPPHLPLAGTILKLRARHVHRELEWYRESRYSADIAALRAALPSLKTLEQYLAGKKTAAG